MGAKPGSKRNIEREIAELNKQLDALRIEIAHCRSVAVELSENEKRFRNYVDNTSDALLRFRPGFGIEYVNPALEKLTGFSIDELKGKSGFLMDRIVDEDIAKYLNALKTSMNIDNFTDPVEFRFINAANELVWCEGRFMAVKDAEGRLEAVDMIARGIGSRKSTEDTLRRLEERFQETIDSMDDYIHIMDRNHTIMIANKTLKKAVEQYGIDTRLVGANVFEAFPFLDDKVRKQYEEVFEKGEALFSDERNVIGAELALTETRKIPIIENGRVSAVITIIRDVTGRKSAEEALRESEELYRTLMQMSPEAIVMIDTGGGITDVSQRILELHGFETAEEIFDRNFFDLAAPQDRERARREIRKTMTEGFKTGIELTMLRNDGSCFIGELSAAALRDAQGTHNAIIITTRDITERKMAEEALRDSEERYRTLAETAQDSIFVVGRDFNVMYVNTFGASSLGMPVDEVIGKPLRVLFPPQIYERQANSLRQVFETGKSLYTENLAVFRGSEVWLDSWLVPLKDSSGAIFAVQGVSRDVTVRKQSEQAVRENEAKYRSLFESSPESITILSTDGTVLDVNAAGEEFTGYPGEFFIGKNVFELPTLRGNDIEALKENFSRILRGEKIPVFEIEVLRKQGDRRWNEVYSSTLERDGEVYAVQVISIDITERKRLEQAKINFLGSISHELRTPLSLILGYSQMLLKENLPPAVMKKLRIINERGRQELKLVEELLTLARFERGETRYEMADTHIWEFVRSYSAQARVMVDNLVEKRFRTREYSFSVEVSDGLKGAIVHCDEERLRQVLDNLLENAVKYSRRERIDLKLAAEREGGLALMRIADRGIGIPPEESDAIFKPFYQIRTGSHPLSDGMGKGLSIVKEHVEAHKGAVRLESEQGEGSVFTIELPIARTMDFKESAGISSILVVDDDRDIVDFVEHLLAEEGFAVTVAFTEHETWPALAEARPDLVLLDIQLPDGDGVEICRRIKSGGALPAPIVYLFSAKPEAELKQLAVAAGADGYISKPFEIDFFVDMLEKIQA